MINFLKNLVFDFFLRRRFKISAQKIKKYEKAKHAFETFLRDSGVFVTGDDYRKIKDEVPSLYRYERSDLPETDHLVIPAAVYLFLLNGGTWKEVEEYDTALKHGMFHGKKGRL